MYQEILYRQDTGRRNMNSHERYVNVRVSLNLLLLETDTSLYFDIVLVVYLKPV